MNGHSRGKLLKASTTTPTVLPWIVIVSWSADLIFWDLYNYCYRTINYSSVYLVSGEMNPLQHKYPSCDDTHSAGNVPEMLQLHLCAYVKHFPFKQCLFFSLTWICTATQLSRLQKCSACASHPLIPLGSPVCFPLGLPPVWGWVQLSTRLGLGMTSQQLTWEQPPSFSN